MANSKYGYVKNFELPDPVLPDTFMLFRLDGHSFHRFTDVHGFEKPNDVRALELMDHAARSVMEEYPDIVLAFGESDEYSFLLKRSTSLYNRRESKIVTTLTSLFTSCYVLYWPKYFPDKPLQYPPSFDGRIVPYPAERHIRDYFAWRQADTHINNLYNTTFWALVQQGGQTTTEAHATLRGTFSKDKHEILYSRFKINYNQLDARYRKGSILVREEEPEVPEAQSEARSEGQVRAPEGPTTETMTVSTDATPSSVVLTEPAQPKEKKNKKASKKAKPATLIVLLHCDIIKDDFWNERPTLLAH
ncbi:Thg1 C terminal domain-containing protein [Ephemerocybe angulata]|uniref:tRNA(His) guanylyltransferase n=1 Tax=Ephemerocybe angulata TaxID=980116 RepID=A0A8H6IHH4_9AGAR|nr:Thg1 C terminal domain-containing protein [Tulosesus angulatus]